MDLLRNCGFVTVNVIEEANGVMVKLEDYIQIQPNPVEANYQTSDEV